MIIDTHFHAFPAKFLEMSPEAAALCSLAKRTLDAVEGAIRQDMAASAAVGRLPP